VFPRDLIALAVYHDGQRSRFGPLLDKVAHPRHRPVVSDPPHEFEGGGYWNVPLAPLRVDHGRASGTSPLRLSYLGRWGEPGPFWDEETAPHGSKAHVPGQGIIYDGVRTLRTLWNDAWGPFWPRSNSPPTNGSEISGSYSGSAWEALFTEEVHCAWKLTSRRMMGVEAIRKIHTQMGSSFSSNFPPPRDGDGP